MNLYNFITRKEIEMVSKSIKGEKDFEIYKKHKDCRFDISSGRAGVDFNSETKEGDYIVRIGFSEGNGGCGQPVHGSNLRKQEKANELKDYINEYIKRRKPKGYKDLEEGQATLFDMMP
ncbi:MAG: hypothetical protein GX366_07210 [Epulopiscium sp.]|nr:hypothetical protein [Candidatus Epulonipiscium sp.]